MARISSDVRAMPLVSDGAHLNVLYYSLVKILLVI
jgi:hypothetical protein